MNNEHLLLCKKNSSGKFGVHALYCLQCTTWELAMWYDVVCRNMLRARVSIGVRVEKGDILCWDGDYYLHDGVRLNFERVSSDLHRALFMFGGQCQSGAVYRFKLGSRETVGVVREAIRHMDAGADIPAFANTSSGAGDRLSNKRARGTEHAHETMQGDDMQHTFKHFTRGDIGGYMAICRRWNDDLNDYELEIFAPRTTAGNSSVLYTCRDKLEQEIKETCADTEYLIVTFQDYVNMELRSAL